MPKEPNSQQLREWYKNFSEILLKNADIDVTKPEHLGLIKNIQVTKWDTTNPDTPDVKIDYAYASESAVPFSDTANRDQHEQWMSENLKPAVTDKQILRLYNMSREGTLMITTPEKGLKDIQMVRTDPNGNIILSQPISTYRKAGNENLPQEDRIPELPEKPTSSLNPEDYGIRPRPVAPVEPANTDPGFWSWLGYKLFGMDTDAAKLERYAKAMETYLKEAHQWELDVNEKANEINAETGEARNVRYEEYRQARAEHDRFSESLDTLMSHPLGKFSAIANSVKDLPVQQQFWAKEHESVKSDFNKTPRGKGREALNEVKKMLRFDERTDSWVHNWIGHDGVPSKVVEWHPTFRVDNLQLTQLELPKAPGFDQMSAGDQAAHMKDMAGLFDLAALSAMSHPDIISKELKPGCTADETAWVIFSPMLNDMFTHGRDNPTEYFKYIEPARAKALDAATAYTQGNKRPLGELLGYGMRQILRDCALLDDLSHRAVNVTYLVGKMYNLLQQDKDLLQASGLKEDELQEARANMELYQIMRQGIQAKKDILDHALEKRTLTPEELQKAAQGVLFCQSVMMGLRDGYKESEKAAYASDEYVELSTKLLDSNFSRMTGRARVQGDKIEASPREIANNRLNLLITYLPANKFTLQLGNKNWLNQYKQAIMDKTNVPNVGNMSRSELLGLFSKNNNEIAATLMPSSKLKAPEPNAPEVQAQKQAEANVPSAG